MIMVMDSSQLHRRTGNGKHDCPVPATQVVHTVFNFASKYFLRTACDDNFAPPSRVLIFLLHQPTTNVTKKEYTSFNNRNGNKCSKRILYIG